MNSVVTPSPARFTQAVAVLFTDTPQQQMDLAKLWGEVLPEPPAKVEQRPAEAVTIGTGIVQGREVVLAINPLRLELKVGTFPGIDPTANGVESLGDIFDGLEAIAESLVDRVSGLVRIGLVAAWEQRFDSVADANIYLSEHVPWTFLPDQAAVLEDLVLQYNAPVIDQNGRTNVAVRRMVQTVQTGSFMFAGAVPSDVKMKTEIVLNSLIDVNNPALSEPVRGEAAHTMLANLAAILRAEVAKAQ